MSEELLKKALMSVHRKDIWTLTTFLASRHARPLCMLRDGKESYLFILFLPIPHKKTLFAILPPPQKKDIYCTNYSCEMPLVICRPPKSMSKQYMKGFRDMT